MLSVFIFSFGHILLTAIIVLVYFGLLHRVLDRLRLSREEALILLLLMIGGTFLPAVPLAGGLALNVGGMLVPLGVAVYLIATADQRVEKQRALLTAAVVAVAVWGLNRLLPQDPGYIGFFDIDPLYMPALAGGTVAYIFGRSRRAAFTGAVLGVLALDLAAWAENLIMGLPQAAVTLGGGGVFGAVVLSGTLSLFLAEVVGEIRERLERMADRV